MSCGREARSNLEVGNFELGPRSAKLRRARLPHASPHETMVLLLLTPTLRAQLNAIVESDSTEASSALFRSIRREKGKAVAVDAGDDTSEDTETEEEAETIDHELLIKFVKESVGLLAPFDVLSSYDASNRMGQCD